MITGLAHGGIMMGVIRKVSTAGGADWGMLALAAALTYTVDPGLCTGPFRCLGRASQSGTLIVRSSAIDFRHR